VKLYPNSAYLLIFFSYCQTCFKAEEFLATRMVLAGTEART